MRSKAIIYITTILTILVSFASCSKWDTDSLGSKFVPANSLVRNFRRQVYVEFSPHSARVWGEAADLVEASIEGCHVRLSFSKDSIALFVYGYTTADTTAVGGDASLTINARTNTGYALYLNGTSIYNPHGPAIQSLGNDQCIIVLSQNSRNNLTSADMNDAEGNANACLYCEGLLQLSGTGTLNINNRSKNTSLSNAICAKSFTCSYNVIANIRSEAGNALVSQDEIIISNGKWDIFSYQSNLKAQYVQLTAGSFNAHCQKGSFIETIDKYAVPAILRSPDITALAHNYTNYADSATLVNLGYVADSLYYPKQFKPEFEFKKDSTYNIYYHRDTLDRKLSTFKPVANLPEGYLLISNSSLNNQDQIFVTED